MTKRLLEEELCRLNPLLYYDIETKKSYLCTIDSTEVKIKRIINTKTNKTETIRYIDIYTLKEEKERFFTVNKDIEVKQVDMNFLYEPMNIILYLDGYVSTNNIMEQIWYDETGVTSEFLRKPNKKEENKYVTEIKGYEIKDKKIPNIYFRIDQQINNKDEIYHYIINFGDNINVYNITNNQVFHKINSIIDQSELIKEINTGIFEFNQKYKEKNKRYTCYEYIFDYLLRKPKIKYICVIVNDDEEQRGTICNDLEKLIGKNLSTKLVDDKYILLFLNQNKIK